MQEINERKKKDKMERKKYWDNYFQESTSRVKAEDERERQTRKLKEEKKKINKKGETAEATRRIIDKIKYKEKKKRRY